MKHDWSPLRRALRPGHPIWWRDDDAVAATAELDGLLALSAEVSVPVHLAVIPALAEPSLTSRLDDDTPVLVHGWRHANTSEDGAKKSEFQRLRPDSTDETAQALARMRTLFSRQLCPIFVPPWNRIATKIAAGLAGQGYAALSTYGPRTAQSELPLPRLNTHVDPIDWRGTRGLVDPDTLIIRTAQQLAQHPDEPLGLLTHHLVHTPQVTAFSRALLLELLDAGAIPARAEALI